MDDPVVELELTTEIQQRGDESVQEYVTRVGRDASVDPTLTEQAAEYATAARYGRHPPDDDDTFDAFLSEVREADLLSDDLEAREAPAQRSLQIETEPPDTGEESASSAGAATEAGRSSDATGVEVTDVDTASETESPLPAFKTGLGGSEVLLLLVRFVAIVVTAPLLGWMMGRAWVPGNSLYEALRVQLAGILGISQSPAIQFAGALGLGLYVSALVLFAIDPKKRVQGALMIVGSVIGAGALAASGVFLPNVEFTTPLNLFGIALGLAVGAAIEFDQLYAIDVGRSTLQRPTRVDGRVVEFRTAARVLYAMLAVAVLASVAQVLLAGVVEPTDVLASGVFLVLGYQFIQYESDTSYTTLGPERSGKSTMMLAMCFELYRNAETDPNPNTYLASGLERASNVQPGNERWPLPSTPHDEARVTSFEVIAGDLFPRRLKLTALDYAGQHLARVAELLEGDAGRDGVGGDGEDGSTPATVANWIGDSDRHLFVLDVERFVFPEKFRDATAADAENISWGLEQYATIIDAVQPEDVIVVATKCDLLVDTGRVPDPDELGSYEEFVDAVTDHLRSRPDVERLLSLAGEEQIFPVYLETFTRNGEYLPKLDATGNFVPVGYDRLLAEIRNRQ